jgi:hypothetical protein
MRYIYKGGAIRKAGERVGHICHKCKKIVHWSTWVFAHWDELMTYKCDCGAYCELQSGRGAELRDDGKRYGSPAGPPTIATRSG